jgi:lambda repressor-like predicted transcriptional regulator
LSACRINLALANISRSETVRNLFLKFHILKSRYGSGTAAAPAIKAALHAQGLLGPDATFSKQTLSRMIALNLRPLPAVQKAIASTIGVDVVDIFPPENTDIAKVVVGGNVAKAWTADDVVHIQTMLAELAADPDADDAERHELAVAAARIGKAIGARVALGQTVSTEPTAVDFFNRRERATPKKA